MAAHPLLLDTTAPAPQSKKDRYKPMQPKFASIKANVRNAPAQPPVAVPIIPIEAKANPYSSAAAANSTKESGFDGAPKEKIGRSFRFNQKGKYIALGNQIRQEVCISTLSLSHINLIRPTRRNWRNLSNVLRTVQRRPGLIANSK
jgi:U4/U6 small nuclear ribonucleoprotein PRP3